MRSTLVLERALRGVVVRRENLAFDTKFGASAPGKLEKVGHLFLLVSGKLATSAGQVFDAPVGVLLADDEIERISPKAATFRTFGPNVDVIQLRFERSDLLVEPGLARGPLPLAGCWDAARALFDGAPRGDAQSLIRLLDTLVAAKVVHPHIPGTIQATESAAFVRLWDTLSPLYQTYGGTLSLKQIAAHLGLSLRQVGRDAKELTATFGFGGGFRDMLLMLRLRVAVLLLSSDATVNDVAKVVGYGSPIAMARAFRDAKLPAPSVVQAELQANTS
jgi:AraC-like DNA-binding protein